MNPISPIGGRTIANDRHVSSYEKEQADNPFTGTGTAISAPWETPDGTPGRRFSWRILAGGLLAGLSTSVGLYAADMTEAGILTAVASFLATAGAAVLRA